MPIIGHVRTGPWHGSAGEGRLDGPAACDFGTPRNRMATGRPTIRVGGPGAVMPAQT